MTSDKLKERESVCGGEEESYKRVGKRERILLYQTERNWREGIIKNANVQDVKDKEIGIAMWGMR